MELAAFVDFLSARAPGLVAECRAHRELLRAGGELPTPRQDDVHTLS
jgi:hypothetical protein